MKYGDTLRQRSIPEWGYYNIDYDFLKDLIKQHTTRGPGKAVSIPGQGHPTERAFTDTFFHTLQAQHDRINRFVKSKTGEIERRLEHNNKRLLRIQEQQPHKALDSRLHARTVEKYARIDADVSKAGEEIKYLSRFTTVQCMGFNKILKKYKRWTRDSELVMRFKADVAEDPTSFFQLDLGYLLDQYIDVLHAVRAPFEQTNSEFESKSGVPKDELDSIFQISSAVERGSELDFDLALDSLSLGPRGSIHTYWIHPDHILETEVILLQYMRLFNPATPNASSQVSPNATPGRRNSSNFHEPSENHGKQDDVGIILFRHEHVSCSTETEDEARGRDMLTGTPPATTRFARWTSLGLAGVVTTGHDQKQTSDQVLQKIAKLKRKQLPDVADLSSAQFFTGSSDSSSSPFTNANQIQMWLDGLEDAKPAVGICAKRTRFLGLQNCRTGALWATLDRDIHMKESMIKDLKHSDWVSIARQGSVKFPHAVLEIRKEGFQSLELVKLLDRSHLVRNVGESFFSLEQHAIWACCNRGAMPEPSWIPLLEKDIRKLPDPVKRRLRKTTSSSSTPPLTTASTASMTDGNASPTSSHHPSTTSGDFLPVPALKNFRRKSSRQYPTLPYPHESQSQIQERYWNEYDNPESEDEGYYIYINPDEEVKFPGQETIEKLLHRTWQLLHFGKNEEQRPLLSVPETVTSEETADESADPLARGYGTLQFSSRESTLVGDYFSCLIPSSRSAHKPWSLRRESERERQSLVTAIQDRNRASEIGKLRLYVTCIAAAFIIDIILSALTLTSRRKERGVVDGVVLFGTTSNLLMLAVALLSMRSRQERLGWAHQSSVFVGVVVVIVLDILLLRWVLRP